MNSSTKFCDNCGATNRSDARFCYACGQPQITYASTATGLLSASYQLKQRYHILEKLGQGGFGAIYKVEDLLFNNALRAAKEMGMRGLSPQETQDAIVAFRNEALLLASLSHPNLPKIYDHFEEHGRWYLVMDYIDGETLEKRIEQSPGEKLSISEVLDIAIQLCTVLGYLHSHEPPIIFRDLKPDNVMMTSSNHLYLIDFGIARFFKPGQSKDTVSLGTPGYASPEQYGRMQTTIRSDIYSLGATLYHLTSGINPGLVPFLFQPLDLDPKLPGNAALETLIMQMLEMKENKRPENTTVVKQEFLRIQQMRHITPAQLPATVPPIIIPPLVSPTPSSSDSPRSLVVAKDGSGQYTSINAAIQAATPNTFILVQKGTYKESLILDKNIDIVGNGSKEQVILENDDYHCIVMQTNRATIRGLSIRCLSGQNNKQYCALAIPQGELFIEDCDITSNAAACIAIYTASTKPTIRYCTIHNGTSNGIAIYDNAQAIIEYCDLSQHAQPALSIATGGNPTVRHCTLHDNQHHAIFVHNNGQGTFEDCDIHHNSHTALTITTQSNPLLLRCQLHHNQQYGVDVQQEGQGSLQDCTIHSNAYDNILIATASTPYFYLCKIYDAQQSGFSITDNGKGTIEYCEIYANTAANISISNGANPLIRYSKIYKGKQSGVHIYNGGQGTITNSTITENAYKPLDIAPGCNVILKGNQS